MDENNARVSKLHQMSLFHAASFMGAIGYLSADVNPSEPPISVRPCVNCGKEKQHNNAYCSSDCCREHREKKKLNFVRPSVGKPNLSED